MKTKKEAREELEEYCVQDTVDGWRQPPIFIGTFEECQEFCEYNHSRFARDVMPLANCKVDCSWTPFEVANR